jgi:solute carrier family 25 protein 16
LTTIDKFFVRKDSRILALSLLCEFIRQQPPHLHQLLSTPLFDNLLKCLQQDTSTRVISLAMTALVMFLPHIPSSASQHLPALFNIYSRMLFWDRERKAAEPEPRAEDDEKSEKHIPEDTSWDKLPYLLESEDEQVPELLHYFTFLYGLYPINFMSYIRKPQRYLRHANFPGADDLDIEPTEIRQRSEPFRRLHLLHPNFFLLTIDSEITDNNRWQKSEAADVVAECMALYCPGEDVQGLAHRSKAPAKKVGVDSDVPEQALVDQEETVTPYQSRHTSWRNTTSTAVASPTDIRHSDLQRKYSQTSQSMPSIADSPPLQSANRHDSPTIPPQMMTSPSINQLSDMLNTQKAIRGSLYQSLTNESVASLALSNTPHDPSHVSTYLESLGPQRSPSLHPTTNDPNLKVAYLHREIQLLRNDLNFERYLKQQHLSHIGQLRRQQIKEARAEAETQNLLNTNRGLRSKLEEAKRENVQMKSESEKSKAHARKWEGQLAAKLRVLRDEQKKWLLERADLKKDLDIAVDKADKLKQLIVTSERHELAARQKTMSVEASLDELERLRDEVENLTLSIRKYEARDLDILRKGDAATETFKRVQLLEMELQARDQELARSKQAFKNELQEIVERAKEEKEEAYVQKTTLSQEMLDSVLESSRKKIAELKRQNERLLRRYNNLQGAYFDLKERLGQREYEIPDEPLLGGGVGTGRTEEGRMSSSPPQESRTIPEPRTPQPQRYRRRAPHKTSDPTYDAPSTSPPNIPLPARPVRIDTSSTSGGISPVESTSRTPVSPAEGSRRSGMGGLASLGAGYGGHFALPHPFSPNPSIGSGGGKGSVDEEGNVKKIVPGSEVRIYGRGEFSPFILLEFLS